MDRNAFWKCVKSLYIIRCKKYYSYGYFFVDFLVVVLAVVFLTTVFLVVAFLAVDFLAVDLFTAAFVGLVGLSLVLAKDLAK